MSALVSNFGNLNSPTALLNSSGAILGEVLFNTQTMYALGAIVDASGNSTDFASATGNWKTVFTGSQNVLDRAVTKGIGSWEDAEAKLIFNVNIRYYNQFQSQQNIKLGSINLTDISAIDELEDDSTRYANLNTVINNINNMISAINAVAGNV